MVFFPGYIRGRANETSVPVCLPPTGRFPFTTLLSTHSSISHAFGLLKALGRSGPYLGGEWVIPFICQVGDSAPGEWGEGGGLGRG